MKTSFMKKTVAAAVAVALVVTSAFVFIGTKQSLSKGAVSNRPIENPIPNDQTSSNSQNLEKISTDGNTYSTKKLGPFEVKVADDTEYKGYIATIPESKLSSAEKATLIADESVNRIYDDTYYVQDPRALLSDISASDVDLIEPNYKLKTMAFPQDAPNDPLYSAQYNLKNTTAGTNAQAFWAAGMNGSGIKVAVIDTGVNRKHEDIGSNVLPGASFINGTGQKVADVAIDNSTNGHGTSSISIIASTANNSKGIAGLAYGATIIPVRVFGDPVGGQDGAYPADLIASMSYAANQGAKIISMSLGIDVQISAIDNVCKDLYNRGMVLVAAAGNVYGPITPTTMIYPAGSPGVIGVGATDSSGNWATYSCYNGTVDIAAPGNDIPSAKWNNNTGYQALSGTSEATPEVAAAIACLMQANPGKNPAWYLSYLQSNSLDRGTTGFDTKYGSGVLKCNPANPLITNLDTSKVYNIKVPASGRVFDIAGGSSANGARIQQYDGNYTTAQRFRLTSNSDGTYTFNTLNGKVIDVSGGIAKSGAVIQQYASNGTNAQKWLAVNKNGNVKLASCANPTYNLDIVNGSTANGAKLQLDTDNGSNAQRFTFSAINSSVANGLYTIRGLGSGKVIDIAGGNANNGAKVQIYTQNNSLAQKFQVSYDSWAGYYSIVNINGNKGLDVKGNGTANHTPIQTWQYGGSANQRWVIEPFGNGYRILAGNGGKALDVAGGSSANGTGLQIYSPNGTGAQQFGFVAANTIENGNYQIETAFGQALDVYNRATAMGTNIQQYYKKNGEVAQKFNITLVSGIGSNAQYTIASTLLPSGNLLLGVNGTNVALVTTGAVSQTLWKFIPNGNKGYTIVNVATGKVLDVAGGSSAPGANIQVYTQNNTKAQQFLALRLS